MSDVWHTFKNAPITEALIDIQVTLPSTTTLETLAAIQENVHERYPIRNTRHHFQARIDIQSESGAQITPDSNRPIGYLFRSADNRNVFQARLNGFTFSRLKPYEKWERLRDDAQACWHIYEQSARPLEINRIAVRYINRIAVPSESVQLTDWIRTAPTIPEGLPNKLGGYLQRLIIPFDDEDATALITQATDSDAPEQPPGLILDIDVFKPVSSTDVQPRLWEDIEVLRGVKNRVFFAIATSKAQESFDAVSP